MIMAEANANSDTADIYLGSSNTVILHLAPGDVADVGACSNIYSLNTSWQTSFSGFLLRAD